MVRLGRLELPPPCLKGRCYYRLSYRRKSHAPFVAIPYAFRFWRLVLGASYQHFPPLWARCPALSVSRCSLFGGHDFPLTACRVSGWQNLGSVGLELHPATGRTPIGMLSTYNTIPFGRGRFNAHPPERLSGGQARV